MTDETAPAPAATPAAEPAPAPTPDPVPGPVAPPPAPKKTWRDYASATFWIVLFVGVSAMIFWPQPKHKPTLPPPHEFPAPVTPVVTKPVQPPCHCPLPKPRPQVKKPFKKPVKKPFPRAIAPVPQPEKPLERNLFEQRHPNWN